jgi:hypothetical protein
VAPCRQVKQGQQEVVLEGCAHQQCQCRVVVVGAAALPQNPAQLSPLPAVVVVEQGVVGDPVVLAIQVDYLLLELLFQMQIPEVLVLLRVEMLEVLQILIHQVQ